MRNEPPCIKGENAPDWLCITSHRYRARGTAQPDPKPVDPAIVAARDKQNAEAKAAANARKAAAQSEKDRKRAENKAANEAAREERQKRILAEREAAMEAELREILRVVAQTKRRSARIMVRHRELMGGK